MNFSLDDWLISYSIIPKGSSMLYTLESPFFLRLNRVPFYVHVMFDLTFGLMYFEKMSHV